MKQKVLFILISSAMVSSTNTDCLQHGNNNLHHHNGHHKLTHVHKHKSEHSHHHEKKHQHKETIKFQKELHHHKKIKRKNEHPTFHLAGIIQEFADAEFAHLSHYFHRDNESARRKYIHKHGHQQQKAQENYILQQQIKRPDVELQNNEQIQHDDLNYKSNEFIKHLDVIPENNEKTIHQDVHIENNEYITQYNVKLIDNEQLISPREEPEQITEKEEPYWWQYIHWYDKYDEPMFVYEPEHYHKEAVYYNEDFDDQRKQYYEDVVDYFATITYLYICVIATVTRFLGD